MNTDQYVRNASLVSVIDGDTIEVLIDLGYDVHKNIRLRLRDVNAAEIDGDSKEKGNNHKKKLKSLLSKKLIIQTFKNANFNDVKTFDRYVAVVYCGNKNINEILQKWIKKN